VRGLVSAPVRVAVIDSGWDRRRSEPRVLVGGAFTAEGAFTPDDHDRLGHGTACIREVLRWAPDAEILPARVFADEATTTPEALAAAIRWSAGQDARVIGLSLGTRRESARPVLEAACEAARAAGAILVSAGPNAGPATYPAALLGVIGVWADAGLAPGELRRRGALDLEGSPGRRAVSPGPGGSSLAAAEVAGRIARLLAGGADADLSLLLELLMQPPR
jgi:subtilisin family serine protease